MKIKLSKVILFLLSFIFSLFLSLNPHRAYSNTNGPFTQTQILTANDETGADLFGDAVSLYGTTLVVGAEFSDIGGNLNQGAVYVFTYSAVSGLWTQSQKLTSNDGAANDLFGDSVGIYGSNLVVGAPGADVGGNNSQGAVYVFTLSNGTWSQSQKLTAADGDGGDSFGNSISIDGLTLLIGAVNAQVGINANQGAAYIFTSSNDTWTQSQKLIAIDGASGDLFGTSVALNGSTLVIGAINATIGGNTTQGAAYVFNSSNGTWTQYQKLTSNDGTTGDLFGQSVSLYGPIIVVGANGVDIAGNLLQGAAYVFNSSNGTWTQSQKLVPEDGAANDNFGISVVINESNIAIGANGADLGEGVGQGAVYIFTSSNGNWTQSQQLSASDGSTGSNFGISIALRGATLLTGADGANAAYVFNAPYVSQSGNTCSLMSSSPPSIISFFIYFFNFFILIFLRQKKNTY